MDPRSRDDLFDGGAASQPGDALKQSRHTFVFADLAGFSALTEAHGDHAAADLVADFSARVAAWLPAFGGGSSKTAGDAVMLRCNEARGALELGLTIIARTRELERFPAVRIGMHTGSAVERDGDWYGYAVNLAARVSEEAGGGEILLTEATLMDAGHMRGVKIERGGPRRFRNLSRPVVVYSALRPHASEPKLIDPVCRMPLSREESSRRYRHGGVEYAFCSRRCERAFIADPERFLGTLEPRLEAS